MRAQSSLAILAALLAGAPAAAEQTHARGPYDRAIAAGYKAAMLCSGIFDAEAMGGRRDAASIEANELKGIYPEYDPLIADLPATIDRKARTVSVPYDSAMPPRIAASETGAGCRVMPIGTTAAAGAEALSVPAPHSRSTAFPAAPAPALAALLDRAFAADFGGRTNTTAVIVLRDGRQLAERYAPGFGPDVPQRTWSAAKSISGTIVGAAVMKGMIDPKAPAPVPEWQRPGDPRAKITLDQLLRMASGLHSATAGNRTDAVYFGGTAASEETVAWPLEVPPGTRFRYANNDIMLAMHALRSRARDDLFPFHLLLEPLGMDHTIPERDWRGDYILSSQVWATARDLATLGQFWLQDGVWHGKRLLPEGWMTYMTTPSGPQPAAGPGYGATMWLFGPKQGLPEGSYAAQGNRGQYVMVVPSKRLVIVRRGEDPAGASFDLARFTAEVIAALP